MWCRRNGEFTRRFTYYSTVYSIFIPAVVRNWRRFHLSCEFWRHGYQWSLDFFGCMVNVGEQEAAMSNVSFYVLLKESVKKAFLICHYCILNTISRIKQKISSTGAEHHGGLCLPPAIRQKNGTVAISTSDGTILVDFRALQDTSFSRQCIKKYVYFRTVH